MSHPFRPFAPAACWRAASAAALALAIAPAVSAAAPAPLHTTSFVRGKQAVSGQYPGPLRAIVGDINGDGKDDAAYSNNTEVVVVYGTSPTADADLAADLGTRGFRIDTTSAGPVQDISAAGDFDHDGYDDLLVATDVTTYVVYGAASTSGTLTVGPGGRMTALTGKGATDLEDDAKPLGDFDGDGYADVVVQRGSIGAAIVSGGPRVASIAVSAAAGGRVSQVTALQRCGIVWFTYKCIYLGVNVEPVGDFDGDGLADVAIQSSAADGNYVLYGRTGRFSTQPTAGTGKTRLPAPTNGELTSILGNVSRAGDVDGDGLDDLVEWQDVVIRGRRGRPAAIAGTEPVVRLTGSTLSGFRVQAIGDQDGDGGDDLAVFGYGSTQPVRVVTGLGRPAPATIDVDAAPAVGGLPERVGELIEGGGDLDGDGLGDLLVGTVGDGESSYVASHGTGSPGSVGRPASLDGTLAIYDALGQWVAPQEIKLSATCAGRTASGSSLVSWPIQLGPGAAEGESCTVTPTITLSDPSAYARCTWRDEERINYNTPVTPTGGAFKLDAGLNHWTLVRRCVLPTTDPPLGFEQEGWTYSGKAHRDDYQVTLTDPAAQQRGAIMWASPLDLRNRTIEFEARMGGGNGQGEGMTLAFVRPGADGKPAGGQIGFGGSLLGFGGLQGIAIALDQRQGPGDPSANFIGFADGVKGTTLNWLQTGDPGVQLRGSTPHKIKVVNKAGTTTVFVDGSQRMRGPLAIPDSAYLAFTGATSTIYQFQAVSFLKITAS